jgi:hypothetical protein
VAQWRELLELAGYQAVEVSLLGDGNVAPRGLQKVPSILRGTVAVETVAWSSAALRRQLAACSPTGMVFVTLRAFEPTVVPAGVPAVVDLVDELSASYRQRRAIDHRAFARVGWGVLAAAMARVERRVVAGSLPVVVAGYGEAVRLGVAWLPVTVGSGDQRAACDSPPTPTAWPTSPEPVAWDVLFTGTLDYPPNIAGLRALAGSIWPEVLRQRPGTTLCVAGRRPGSEVRSLVRSLGATLLEGFSSFAELASRSTVAVAPLPVATGIQIKALQAAAHGLPMVLTPTVADGLDPEFPAAVASSDRAFADEVLRLLREPVAAIRLGAQGKEHVERLYVPQRWVAVVRSLLRPSAG